MGRRRDVNHSPPPKKKIQYSIHWEMEKIDTQFLTSKKTKINVTKVPSDAHKKKKNLKEEISKKFMEKILDMVSQNVQNALKKFQGTHIKIVRKHRNK
jgi:tRNA A37 threonylcarbamoyltransferase TsaD